MCKFVAYVAEYLEKRDFKKFIIDKEILRELMEHPDPKSESSCCYLYLKH